MNLYKINDSEYVVAKDAISALLLFKKIYPNYLAENLSIICAGIPIESECDTPIGENLHKVADKGKRNEQAKAQ